MSTVLFTVPSPLLSYDADLCALIDLTAREDARADTRQGDQAHFRLMAELYAEGNVRGPDWARYCGMYAVEASRL